jgi:hypothetical protein
MKGRTPRRMRGTKVAVFPEAIPILEKRASLGWIGKTREVKKERETERDGKKREGDMGLTELVQT